MKRSLSDPAESGDAFNVVAECWQTSVRGLNSHQGMKTQSHTGMPRDYQRMWGSGGESPACAGAEIQRPVCLFLCATLRFQSQKIHSSLETVHPANIIHITGLDDNVSFRLICHCLTLSPHNGGNNQRESFGTPKLVSFRSCCRGGFFPQFGICVYNRLMVPCGSASPPRSSLQRVAGENLDPGVYLVHAVD